MSSIKKYTCPCCGYKTLTEEPPGTYEICSICFWEDDPIQFNDPFYEGGANGISLMEAQRNYQEFGACEKEMIKNVRKPNIDDEKDINWKMVDLKEDSIEKIIVDLSNISSVTELHELLKQKLEFPSYYGMNWDAFWDSITGLITMPKVLVLVGWINVETRFSKDSRIMKNLLEEYNNYYPRLKCQVFYN